jgi:LPXTG-site transpeptidase (sortase) family protein
MKKALAFTFLSVCVAVMLILTQNLQPASSSMMGFTNTPSEPTTPPVEPTAAPTHRPTSRPSTEAEMPATGEKIETIGRGYQRFEKISSSEQDILMVEFPRIKVFVAVKPVFRNGKSWDVSQLGSYAGWLNESAFPGMGGNVVLAGHVTSKYTGSGPFREIGRLLPGDEIKVYTSNRVFTYAVAEKKVVDTYNAHPIDQTPFEQLTLVTCLEGTWDAKSQSYLKRLVLFGHLQDSKPWHPDRMP